MTTRTVTAKLQANISGYKAAMGDAVNETRKLESQIAKSARNNQAAFTTLGVAGVAVGAAIALGLGKVIGASMDFEKQMSGVQAVSGATADEMDRLSDAAIAAGADVALAGVTASSAAQAQAELVKAGVAVSDVLGGALQGSLSLAVAGNLDMAKSAEIAAQAMNVFKLEGSDVGHVADVLAAAANKSAADVGSLGEGMRQAGLVAAQTGLNLEDTVGTLSAFADRALVGSDAGTSLKTMLQRLTPQSEEAGNLFRTLGINAFDASGEFVGMAELAGELQDSLGGMSTESRNTALNVLFGADAIRGANVLYELGEEGVRDYTAAVNDSGAATRMAAAMTDNLAGDLEALGGAVESVMIDFGENAQGPLRVFAQGLTGIVEGIGKLPEPAQTAAIGVGGLASAASLAAGGFLLAAPRIVQTKDAMAALAETMPRTIGGMRAIGRFLTGPWGIALGAAVISVGLLMREHEKGEEAIREYTDAVEADSGALAENTRAATVNRLEKAGALKLAQDMGVASNLVVDAVIGEAGAREKLNGILSTYGDIQGSALDGDRRMQSMAWELEDAIFAEARALEDGTDAAYRKAVALDTASESSVLFALGLHDAEDASLGAAIASERAGGAAVGMDDAMGDLAPTMEDVTSKAKAMEDAFASLGGTARDLDAAAIGWEASLDELRKTLEDNGSTLDIDTKKGRENKEAILGTVDALEEHLTALADNGASMRDLKRAIRGQIEDFRDTATEAGLTDKQIDKLIDRYGLIPKKIMTRVHADTAGAEADLRRVAGMIEMVNSQGITYRVPAAVTRGPEQRATGGDFGPGWILAGERGPELLKMGQGGHVFNDRQTSAMLGHVSSAASGFDYGALASAVQGGRMESKSTVINVEAHPVNYNDLVRTAKQRAALANLTNPDG